MPVAVNLQSILSCQIVNSIGFAFKELPCNDTFQSQIFIKLMWTFTGDICHLEFFPLIKLMVNK